jgi:hypothetical protein
MAEVQKRHYGAMDLTADERALADNLVGAWVEQVLDAVWGLGLSIIDLGEPLSSEALRAHFGSDASGGSGPRHSGGQFAVGDTDQ